MKKTIGLAISLILLVSSAYALYGSYMYVGLGYGRGWWPWVCVTEMGAKNVCGCPGNDFTGTGYSRDSCELSNCITNFCNARKCTVLEKGALMGQHNCLGVSWIDVLNMDSGKMPDPSVMDEINMASMPTNYGVLVKITIPEDMKLVQKDGTVVGDELCVGDLFSLTRGPDKGEYFDDGGNMDTPSIYWVDSVQDVVAKIMAYHERVNLDAAAVSIPKPADGFVDPVTGIPIYNGPYITGRLICSMGSSQTGISGVSKEGGYYKVTGGSDVLFGASMPVECMYYYFGEQNVFGYSAYRLPQIINKGPDADFTSATAMNNLFNTKSDFFRVGSLSVNKTIKVVKPAMGGAAIDVVGADGIKYGSTTDLRVLVKNTGDTEITIRRIYANCDYKLISCDQDKVAVGGTADCLISITPKTGQKPVLTLGYEYKSCGKARTGIFPKALMDSKTLTPKTSLQVYSIGVHSGCENNYYGCVPSDREGNLIAGYECYNQNGKYYSAGKERFNLKYELPDLSSKTILGASLTLSAGRVNKPQTLTLYSADSGWEPATCRAGGDICTQPHCGECKGLFDMPGGQLAQTKAASMGLLSFDISSHIKEAYSRGDTVLSFQVRGEEDLWETGGGAESCGGINEWSELDVEFQGAGGMQPYLEIFYR
jgi:hypothetical protein